MTPVFLSLPPPPCASSVKPQTHEALSGLELTMPKRAKAIRPPPVDSRPKNKFLACLPRADFERLRPLLKTIPLKVKQILHPVNEPVRDVFFLNGGVASMTTVMKNGAWWKSRRSVMRAWSGSTPSSVARC
jgi:hypothetical protein